MPALDIVCLEDDALDAELARHERCGRTRLPAHTRWGKALAPTKMDRGSVLIAIEQMADLCSTLFGIPCEAVGEPRIAATLTDSAAQRAA
jgi:hypothetical protein